MNSSEEQNFKVLMFPWLAYGHISPFLGLAKKLSLKNFDIYICSTPATLSSIKTRITHHYSKSIHLLDLHLPADSLPELPPHCHTTNGLHPRHHPALMAALESALPDFSSLVESVQPHLLIVDLLTKWAHSVASVHGVPALTFSSFGAAPISYISHLEKRPGTEFPFPSIRSTGFEQSMGRKNVGVVKRRPVGVKEIVLMNTSRVIDGKYMDYVFELKNWDVKPLGALVQCSTSDDDGGDGDDELIKWLGTKPESSTVFVSFGSESFFSSEEMGEVAYGLETSNANFIWVVRASKGEEMRAQELLPQGFVERVEGRGKIVENWAPQVKILKHPSIAGFVSHCGWNSVLESIEIRIPIIGVPIHLDQPVNAKLQAPAGAWRWRGGGERWEWQDSRGRDSQSDQRCGVWEKRGDFKESWRVEGECEINFSWGNGSGCGDTWTTMSTKICSMMNTMTPRHLFIFLTLCRK